MKYKPRTQLTNASWQRLANKIPDIRRCSGAGDHKARRFVEGVLWIMRTGAPWRDLPGYFGRWSTVYRRFRRWTLGGVWNAVHRVLVASLCKAPVFSIDSTIVRAHQHAAGGRGGMLANAIGISRGGRTTKIHAVVASDAIVLTSAITPGQEADIKQAQSLVNRASSCTYLRQLLADRAYDADAFVDWLKARRIEPVIPSRCHRRQPRSLNKRAYRNRNQVERFFAHIKQYRRVATRYDKTVASFAAGVVLAGLRPLMRASA